MDLTWLRLAIQLISEGACDKMEKDNIIAYRCGKVIRIDVKDLISD